MPHRLAPSLPARVPRDTLRRMKPDIYTKAVLTVIAVALVAIASNQYTNPRTTVQAQASPFAGVQFTGGRSEFYAF